MGKIPEDTPGKDKKLDDRVTEQVPEEHPVYYQEEEIDLTDLISVLWRRRWFMLIVILVITGIAAAYAFLSTPKYEIVSQVKPGITGYNQDGSPRHTLRPKDIKEWFDKKAYLSIIERNHLVTGTKGLPDITASNPRNADVISISFFWPDPAQGRALFSAIFEDFKKTSSMNLKQNLAVARQELAEKIATKKRQINELDIEAEKISNDIGKQRNQIGVLKAGIDFSKKERAQLEQLIKNLKIQVDSIDKNTADLLTQRNSLLSSSDDKLSLLMYSNIIQQNIAYITNLYQRINDLENQVNKSKLDEISKKKAIKDIEAAIRELELKKAKELPLERAALEERIATLKVRLDSLSPIEIVQAPFSSTRPVKPAKKKVVAIAFVFGCFVAVFAAFIVDFLARSKNLIAEEASDQD